MLICGPSPVLLLRIRMCPAALCASISDDVAIHVRFYVGRHPYSYLHLHSHLHSCICREAPFPMVGSLFSLQLLMLGCCGLSLLPLTLCFPFLLVRLPPLPAGATVPRPSSICLLHALSQSAKPSLPKLWALKSDHVFFFVSRRRSPSCCLNVDGKKAQLRASGCGWAAQDGPCVIFAPVSVFSCGPGQSLHYPGSNHLFYVDASLFSELQSHTFLIF